MPKNHKPSIKARYSALAALVAVLCGSVGVADARVIQVMPGTTASYTFFPKELVTNKNQLPVVVEGSACLNPAEEGKVAITAAGVGLVCKTGSWKRPSSTPIKVEGAACANPGEEGYLAVTATGVGLICHSGLWKRPKERPASYSCTGASACSVAVPASPGSLIVDAWFYCSNPGAARTIGIEIRSGATLVLTRAVSCHDGYGLMWSERLVVSAALSGTTWTINDAITPTSEIRLTVTPTN